MLHPTDLMLPPAPTLAAADWGLPQQTLDLLARVAPTSLPVLCTACFGAAFRRIANAVHLASGREHLLFVDLRRSGGTLPAGLPDGDRAARTTLALDGLEHLDAAGQDFLAILLARSPFRLICATDVALDLLGARWRADLLAHVSTVTVATPALARRGDAIAEVARQRLTALSRELGRDAPDLAPDAASALAGHAWPGDLAELDAVLARTLLATGAPVIDGVAIRFRPDGSAMPPPGADDGEIRLASGRASERAQVIREVESPTEPPSGTRDATTPGAAFTSDEALISTLPTPGLFRKRGDDAPAVAGHVRPESRGLAPASTPTLEALAVELAHQLKNPLVTIKTFVASIESLRDDPQEMGQFRALTDEAVTRMDEILDGLLAFARLHAPAHETFDAVALLRDALRSAWRVLSSKHVELDAPDDVQLCVRADREHLRFALATLARHVAETIEPRTRLAIAVEAPAMLRFDYHESGAITHLRGASHDGDPGLPLALLLVRGALARVEGDVEIALQSKGVSIRLRLASS